MWTTCARRRQVLRFDVWEFGGCLRFWELAISFGLSLRLRVYVVFGIRAVHCGVRSVVWGLIEFDDLVWFVDVAYYAPLSACWHVGSNATTSKWK